MSKIHGRNPMEGRGMMSTPEKLAELEERKDRHERLTRGKATKTFGEIFDAKMKNHRRIEEEARDRKKDQNEDEAEEQEEKDGAIDPLLGLSPGQDAKLANPSKDRRSAKFIVKG